MTNYKSGTLKNYLDVLSKKEPVPGGGSAAALTGALALSLISMATRYSIGKGKSQAVEKKLSLTLKQSEQMRKRLLALVDLDAQAYMQVVKARKNSTKQKREAAKKAKAVSKEISQLCYKAIQLTPSLVKNGNPYLLSDVEIAIELILASYSSSKILENVN